MVSRQPRLSAVYQAQCTLSTSSDRLLHILADHKTQCTRNHDKIHNVERDVVWEHGENLYPGWRCNYCHTSKGGGGVTRLKQHLAGRGTEVVHCRKVSKEVCELFQRELDRTKKATADRNREKLRKEKVAAEGNYPAGDEAYDEEADLERALHQSRAKEEFRQGVQQRGGAYEHGGGSGSRGGNPVSQMFGRSSSVRQTPGVVDYNLGCFQAELLQRQGLQIISTAEFEMAKQYYR